MQEANNTLPEGLAKTQVDEAMKALQAGNSTGAMTLLQAGLRIIYSVTIQKEAKVFLISTSFPFLTSYFVYEFFSLSFAFFVFFINVFEMVKSENSFYIGNFV